MPGSPVSSADRIERSERITIEGAGSRLINCASHGFASRKPVPKFYQPADPEQVVRRQRHRKAAEQKTPDRQRPDAAPKDRKDQ
jgi:hypothetical protein